MTPVTTGKRHVLVTEYWRGPARTCPHRCDTINGECNFDPSTDNVDMFFEEIVGATEGGLETMAAMAAATDADRSEDSADDEVVAGKV